MARALEEVLACPVRVAPQPQYTGALGAALSVRAAKPPGGGDS
jgi:activator of 2-hydroxyglutaryl-CoA dehydratase